MTFKKALSIIKKSLAISACFLLNHSLAARDFYWINGSGNWSETQHWSFVSGGSSCGLIPGEDDQIFFDKNSSDLLFPIIFLDQNSRINSFHNSSDKGLVMVSSNFSLTITNEIDVEQSSSFLFSDNAKLILQNTDPNEGKINTHGIALNCSMYIEGNWSIEDHLILTPEATLSFLGGEIQTNGNTLAAGNVLFNQSTTTIDLSGSTVYAYNEIDLSRALGTGDPGIIYSSTGHPSGGNENDFPGSSWFKSTTNCVGAAPLVLTLNVITNYNGEDISCFDSCDAQIQISTAGTPGPYSYSLNGGPFGSQTIFTDLCAGNYTVTVIDSSNQIVPGLYAQCSVAENVAEPSILTFPPPFVVQPTCPSTCDGQAFSFPGGGTGALTVFWATSGETTANPVGLCVGNNPVTVTDANGCTLSDVVVINSPPPILPGETITPPTCAGDVDAEILLNPSGGNGGPYTIVWNPIPASGQGTNPGIGFDNVTVTVSIFDVDGCQKDTSFTIVDPPVLTVNAALVANTSCFGFCDGDASATPVGGTGGYTFEWFNFTTGLTTGITDQNPSILCAGTYYVVVTDAGGCFDQSGNVTINQPTEVTGTATSTDMSCFDICDGTTSVVGGGGTPGYTYAWEAVPAGTGLGATSGLNGLCAGLFEITVFDANGCPSSPDTVEVIQPTPVTQALTSTNPTCYDLCDGTATTVAGGGVGGYTYTWVPAPGLGQGTANGTNMCDGAYTVTVADANGCDVDTTFTITNPPQYDITATQTDLLCSGDVNGTISVTVNSGGSGAGYTYTWAPVPPVGQGTPNVSGLGAGIWTVTIEDALLCDTTLSFTITSPAPLNVNASVISQVSCFGDCNGSGQVVIAGGTAPYNILWDDGASQTTAVASNLCDGIYTVTVTDDNGCVATDNITITQPAPFNLTTSFNDIICFGDCTGSATVTMIGGGSPPYNILWDDAPLNQTTFTAINLCAGNYTATVTDQNLCDTVLSFTISEPPAIVITVNSQNSACFGTCSGSADISAVGGTGALTYQWYDDVTGLPIAGETNTTISNLCPGDYYCVVTDAAGCSIASNVITIIELPEIIITLDSFVDATCGLCDGQASITASGGTGAFSYNWAPAPGAGQGTPVVTGLCAGANTVTITDGLGCTENLIVPINNVAGEILQLDSVNTSCFSVCDGQLIANFNSIDPPYTLEWFDNSTGLTTGVVVNPAVSPVTSVGFCQGDYLAVLTNNTGCTVTGVITLNEPTEITAVITPTDVDCAGNCNGTATAIAAGGAGGYTYSWNPVPGGGQGTPNAVGLCDGNYTLTVTDMTGCNENFTTTISEPIALVIDNSSATDISCFGANDGSTSVITSGGIPPISYEWFSCTTGLSTGITSAVASNLGPDTYQVVVTDANGCSVTGPCLVVNEPPSLTATLNTSNVNCFGNCDGLMDVQPAGGTAPYFYQWQDEFGIDIAGQTNDTMNNVCQGIYNVEVTDFSGCSITFGPIDMTAPASPWVVTTAYTDPTCSGTCDGTATVTVLGGNNPPYSYQWDDPFNQVTGGATNLCAGTWTVTISDAGICDTTISFTLIAPTSITSNATITDNLCFGDCNGTVVVNPFGGTLPYTISWTDGQLGATASGLCAGAITVNITDGLGCTEDTTINITEPADLIVNSSFSNNATCGVCNASATVNMAGGVPPYTYDWTPDPAAGEGTNNASGLCSGVVTCTVTDMNGCTETPSFPISDVNGETVTITSTDESCFGACDGTADAVYVCGDPACTQEWYNATSGLSMGVFTATISNLCADDYFVEVINNSGCVSVETATISGPTQIIDNATITPVICNNDSNGSITLNPTGGSGAGYTYVWNPVPSNGQGTNQALNIGAGSWTVDITDGSGCTETYVYDITNPPAITITSTPTDPSCAVFCNGMISIVVAGGYGGFTYQWTSGGVPIPGATSTLITNLCSGNYNVDVTDLNGCTVNMAADITLSEPVPVSAPISGTDVLCFGDCSGTATVVPSGGFPPYIVNWYDAGTSALIGQTGTTAINLCAGTYYAVITDNNGCNFTSPNQTINEPAQLTSALTTTDASCFGFCDGTGDLVLGGGTIPYSYEWLDIMGNPIPGGTTSTINNLCEGNYTVEGTDGNGCSTGIMFIAINGFPEITGNVFTNDANCGVADGNATVFANGGNPPYTYQWMDNLMIIIPGQTASTLINAFAGTYFVEVTDANGCSEIFQADISNFSSTTITWDSVLDPSCFGLNDGSISITLNSLNPPLSYTWNPGGIIAEDPTGLAAGTYTVQVTDATGCINFYSTTLNDPAEITISSVSTPSDCGQCNGSVTVTPAGGTGALTTIWNNGGSGTSIAGLCSGVYEAQVTDANGCVLTEQVDVANTGGLISDQIITSITCAGGCDGAITVTGLGGTPPYNYLWLHDGSNSDTQSNLCAGSYFVTITDATGCSVNVQIDLADPNPITAVATITNPDCLASNGAISVVSADGNLPHSYQWDTGPVTPAIGGLSAGVYTLTITDASGCSMDFVYGLNNLNAAVITLTATDVNCYNVCDGTIDTLDLLGGTAPFVFDWMDGTGTSLGISTPLITGLCEGDYLVEVTDANGCISFQSQSITQPDTILLNPLFLIDPTCFGVCDGSIISNPIGGTLPFNFVWDDPASQTTFTATGLCDGTFNVNITDANGCSVSQSGTLVEPSAIVISIDNITDAACLNSNDGAIDITASGGTPGYTYEWISQTLTDTMTTEDISGLLPMNYSLTVTDQNGCIAQDTVSVDTLLVVLANAGLDEFLCYNDTLTLIGSSNIIAGVTYNWYDSLGVLIIDTNVMVLPPVAVGNTEFIFEVSFSGCTHQDTVIVTMNGQITVDAGPDIDLYTTQTGGIGGTPTTTATNTVLWSPSTYLNNDTLFNPTVIKPQVSTMYYVTATDTNGCTAIDSMYVEVLPDIIIPDGISPNGDNLNDTWILDFLDQYPGVSITIQVYNRWGELLFESDENYADDWDGTTKNNKKLPAGTYYYVIDIDHEDFPDPFTGPITIMW